jgi:mono/diheme cytochrome c family protein
VLVGNGQGGFTERRVAVSTDAIGGARVVPAPVPYQAPASPVPTSGNLLTWLEGGYGELPLTEPRSGAQVKHRAFAPDTRVYVQHSLTGAMLPPGGPAAPARADVRGRVIIPGVTPPDSDTDYYNYFCSRDGTNWADCDQPLGFTTAPSFADYIGPSFPNDEQFVVGRVRLADDSACGTKNEFFDIEIVGSASLRNAAGGAVGNAVRMSTDGDFSFQKSAGAAGVRITCQSAPVLNIAITPGDPLGSTQIGLRTTPGVRAPVVSAMSATLGATSLGLFLPPPSGLPSDNVPASEFFFGYKGIDTRRSACQYYKAIGAVRACGAAGNFIGPINVEDWRRTVRTGAYATAGTPEYAATYINQVDLNLTRNHHSISYGPNHTAAYFCNHLGPTVDALQRSTQAQVDAAIANAVAGKNLVACVMMDSIASPGVNGGRPYTRFLIFGPSGELLPSINLDGRREKFVPGVCVACHGGDRYAGKFPEDGSGRPDIGAHFLPYDAGNFAFSSAPGLTRAEQELQIYNLNQNVLKAGATSAAQDLISGWYAGGTTQNSNYLPPSWAGTGWDDVYHKVFAHNCRTCHVNMPERWNFDHFQRVEEYIERINLACSREYSGQHRRWGMPNSLVTFNRFWVTKDQPDDLTGLLARFITAQSGGPSSPPPTCELFRIP